MAHVAYMVVLVVASVVFARLEVQIEGGSGWATSLPTWRVENRWTRAVLGNRAVTGYHVYCHLLVFTLAHLVWALGVVEFSWRLEARILSFLILFWVLEDFLWFVFNPEYGVRGFTRERAWWHAENWWGFMPRDYWLFTPLALGLYVWSWAG